MLEQIKREMKDPHTPDVSEGGGNCFCYALSHRSQEAGSWAGHFILDRGIWTPLTSWERCSLSNRVIYPALVQMFKISEINNALFPVPNFPWWPMAYLPMHGACSSISRTVQCHIGH